MTDPDDTALGVYIHWPYCARICPYCDFNVYKTRAVDGLRWQDALIRDLEHWAARTPGRRLTSLYFGGGTPSLAPPALVAAVIAACRQLWPHTDDLHADGLEITLEANPTDAERVRLDAFRDAGVNRLSLGVQSLDDAALRFLGRNHGADEALRAIATAQAVFPRMTFDLIYALPGQSVAAWTDELRRAIGLGASHLSLYQLTVEPGTAFDRAVVRGAFTPADSDRAAALYEATQCVTSASGLPAYEVSNHARAGQTSRHNLLYWRGGDYAGVGPGAHGRLTLGGVRRAIETARDPAEYLSLVERTGAGVTLDHALSDGDRLTERLAMGLRMAKGIHLSADDWRTISERTTPLVGDGLLIREGDRLAASPRGLMVLNSILKALLI